MGYGGMGNGMEQIEWPSRCEKACVYTKRDDPYSGRMFCFARSDNSQSTCQDGGDYGFGEYGNYGYGSGDYGMGSGMGGHGSGYGSGMEGHGSGMEGHGSGYGSGMEGHGSGME